MRADAEPASTEALPAPSPIREWRDVDPRRFAEEIVQLGQPAVLRGLAAERPLVRHAQQSAQALVDYLIGFDTGALIQAAIIPPEEQGRMAYRGEEKELNHRVSTEKLPNVLKGLIKLMDAPSPPGVAIGGLNAETALPGLADENRTDLVPEGALAHLWIGNRVTVSPHFDAADNLAVCVAGRRRFALFPPEQVANLYVGPFDLTPAGVPIGTVPLDNPDFDRFPKYREALAVAQVAELDPGDAIYIPYLWWHGVQSLETFNMLANFWWHRDEVAAAQPFGRLLRLSHELFRDMPPEHRAAWRPLFDYWVFEAGGDPSAHLPPAQQTVRQHISADAIAKFKQALAELFS